MKLTPEESATLDRVIRVWGVEPQWRQVQEECAELIVMINHTLRKRATPDQLAEEVADVAIMVEQAKRMLGKSPLVERLVKKKLERLGRRLDHEESRRAQGLDAKGDEGLVK